MGGGETFFVKFYINKYCPTPHPIIIAYCPQPSDTISTWIRDDVTMQLCSAQTPDTRYFHRSATSHCTQHSAGVCSSGQCVVTRLSTGTLPPRPARSQQLCSPAKYCNTLHCTEWLIQKLKLFLSHLSVAVERCRKYYVPKISKYETLDVIFSYHTCPSSHCRASHGARAGSRS